jgi:hypothetical protein
VAAVAAEEALAEEAAEVALAAAEAAALVAPVAFITDPIIIITIMDFILAFGLADITAVAADALAA